MYTSTLQEEIERLTFLRTCVYFEEAYHRSITLNVAMNVQHIRYCLIGKAMFII